MLTPAHGEQVKNILLLMELNLKHFPLVILAHYRLIVIMPKYPVSTENNHPVVAVKKYGKGRVVALAYLENGFIPQPKNPWGTGLHYSYWEYMWSLVAKSVIWAAGKKLHQQLMMLKLINYY